MLESKKLSNNITIHKVHEPKFNEVLVNMKISMPLCAYQNTVASLLVRMMGDRTNHYNTKQVMREHLDFLYGARTSTQTYTLGSQQILDISVKAIHPKFVDENLTQLQLELLSEMVFEPLLTEATLQEAKVNLKHYHARVKESTSHYALQQAFKLAAPGTLLEINSIGEPEDIDRVTLDEIKMLHKSVASEFIKDVILVGDVSDFNNFSMFDKGHGNERINPLVSSKINNNYVAKSHPGVQTELVYVYSTDINPYHELYGAYLVFTALLGQLPSSYLFQNIREKNSLAYSIYASRQLYDGLMYIATGINDENLEKAKSLIEQQFELMKQDSLDVDGAIRYLIMSLEGTFEKLKPIADHTYRNIVLGMSESIQNLQAKLSNVTEDQVKEVISHLSKPFIFAYRGETHE